MKNNYLIFYQNGKINVYEEINETFKHLIIEDVILYIYDTKNNMLITKENNKINEIKMTITKLN